MYWKITWPPLIHTSALKVVPLVVRVCTVGFVKCFDISVFFYFESGGSIVCQRKSNNILVVFYKALNFRFCQVSQSFDFIYYRHGFFMSKYFSLYELQNAIAGIGYEYGDTNTAAGLRLVRERYFGGTNGDRQNIQNFCKFSYHSYWYHNNLISVVFTKLVELTKKIGIWIPIHYWRILHNCTIYCTCIWLLHTIRIKRCTTKLILVQILQICWCFHTYTAPIQSLITQIR